MARFIGVSIISLGFCFHDDWKTRIRPTLSSDMDRYAAMGSEEKVAQDVKGDRVVGSGINFVGGL